MKKFFSVLFFLSFFLIENTVLAAPKASEPAYKAGLDYTLLKPAQTVDTKPPAVEVTEFFWYGCPHCEALDPYLESWVKKQGKNIVFKRVPVALIPKLEAHQRLYYALVSLGKEKELSPKIFKKIQSLPSETSLITPETQADFLAQYGIDRKQYIETYNSEPSMSIWVNHANSMVKAYDVKGVPLIAIQGKYLVSLSTAYTGLQAKGVKQITEDQLRENMFKTADYLIKQVRAKKM